LSADGNFLVYNSAYAEESQFHIMLMDWKTKEKKQLKDDTSKSQQAPVLVEKRR